MEKNNSKQVLFSIIGVAVLVVAVVGVSFAFFTYSRTGETNNVITTGKIVFNFGGEEGGDGGGEGGAVDPDTGERTPGDVVTGETEPKDDDEGKKQKPKSGVELGGQVPENLPPVDFVVYLVEGDLPKDSSKRQSGGTYTEADRMSYEFIKVYVEPDLQNSSENVKGTIQKTIETKYSTGDLVLGDLTNGKKVKIASGQLANDNVERTYAYMFSMWISTDLMEGQVSDTDKNARYRASSTDKGVLPAGQDSDERKVYGDLFYSVKLRIEAGDQVAEG